MLHFISNQSKSNNHIFFIHGNSSSSKVFEPFVNSDQTLYNVIAYDLLGNGESSKKGVVEDYSLENHIKGSIDFINSFEGDKILVGHSYGGHLAVEISENIKNLKGLTIFGTPPVKKPLNLEEAFSDNPDVALFFEQSPDKTKFSKLVGLASSKKDTHAMIIEDFYNTDTVTRLALSKNIELNSFQNEYEIFKNLNIPKLILHGDKDPLVNLKYIEMLAEESNAELKIIEDCAHYISIEKPELFKELILEFATKCFQS